MEFKTHLGQHIEHINSMIWTFPKNVVILSPYLILNITGHQTKSLNFTILEAAKDMTHL